MSRPRKPRFSVFLRLMRPLTFSLLASYFSLLLALSRRYGETKYGIPQIFVDQGAVSSKIDDRVMPLTKKWWRP